MKKFVTICLGLTLILCLLAGDVLAADRDRDRVRDRLQDSCCQQDCQCDGPSGNPDCPQYSIQQRDRDQTNRDEGGQGVWALFRWMLGWGWD